MTATSLFAVVLAVVEQRDPMYGCDDGDRWLGHYDPDSAYLKCGELASAIVDAINNNNNSRENQ